MSYPRELWPWSGHFAVTIAVSSSAYGFTGDVSGQISLTISSPMVGIEYAIRHAVAETL